MQPETKEAIELISQIRQCITHGDTMAMIDNAKKLGDIMDKIYDGERWEDMGIISNTIKNMV